MDQADRYAKLVDPNYNEFEVLVERIDRYAKLVFRCKAISDRNLLFILYGMTCVVYYGLTTFFFFIINSNAM
jgi:hypothetical protein